MTWKNNIMINDKWADRAFKICLAEQVDKISGEKSHMANIVQKTSQYQDYNIKQEEQEHHEHVDHSQTRGNNTHQQANNEHQFAKHTV